MLPEISEFNSMKRNSLKYVLIGGVLLIWGTIIYKVVTSFNKPAEPSASIPNQTIPRLKNADTFSLLLNYKDPFILTEEPFFDTIQSNELNKISATPLTTSNNPDVSTLQQKPDFVKYTGYIYNPGKKKQIAMVTIREDCFAMEENEEKNEILLKKISKNNITIRYKGAKFTIAKSY